MFGFFGKGAIAPMPAQPQPQPAEPSIPLVTVVPEAVSEDITIEQDMPAPSIPSGPTETEQMKSRLETLRADIENKRKAQMAKVQALRAKQAQQAAYGRDTQQIRPKTAGYATESEKIMGGQTGYGNYTLGQISKQVAVDQAATEVKQATKAVESVTHDVKMGLATKAELERAMVVLDQKIKAAKQVSRQYGLQGYGDTSKKLSPLLIVGFILMLYLIFKK